jgi:hypothetical protein
MQAPAGLTLEELLAGAPAFTGPYEPVPLLEMVIRTELRAGRITQRNDRFALNAERWTPEQVDALRVLAFEP